MSRSSSRRRELERAAHAALELRRRRKAYPLAYGRLWHHDPPRTSQRRAILALAEPGVMMVLVLGGNRAGKSDLVVQWSVACAAGRDAVHEGPEGEVRWVARWLAANGLPESMIPEGPGDVWAGSTTFGAAVDQIRPKLRRWCPAGTTISGYESRTGEAVFRLPGGGTILSKAYRQWERDRQTWEGAAIRAAALDEQPPAYDLLGSLFARLVDQRGQVAMALTPLRGRQDWLYQQLVRDPPPWLRIAYLHGADNPHIPQDMREMMLAASASWQRASRDRGEFSDPEGRVYPFDRALHVIPPTRPPAEWTRWVGVDWGARAPHVLWAAESPAGRLIVYRELAPRRSTLEPGLPSRRLIEWAIEAERGSPEGAGATTVYRVADSEDPGAITEAAELGWWVMPAAKGPGSVLRGIELVEALLLVADPLTGEAQPPRIQVTSDCPVVIEEMEGLRWAPPRPGSVPQPDPACPDHGPDALRYIVQARQALGYR